MGDESVTRREYTLTLGTVGTVGLAGCSLSPGDSPSGNESGNSTASEVELSDQPERAFPTLSAAEPTFRNWIPGTGEQRNSFRVAVNIGRLRRRKAQLPAEAYESQTGWVTGGGYLGMAYEEIEGFLAALGPGVYVVTGSVTSSTVRSRLEPTGFEQFEKRERITYYRGSAADQPALLGVAEEGIVYGKSERDAETFGQPFIDKTVPLYETVRGERSPLHEESELYDRYTTDVGWPLATFSHLPESRDADTGSAYGLIPAADAVPDEMVSAISPGFTRHLAENSLVDHYWLHVAEDTDVAPDQVREAYRTAWIRSQFEDDQRIAVRLDGRVVTVAILNDIDAAGQGADPPLAAIDVSLESGTAIIEHHAGDPVDLERVTVLVDGSEYSAGSGTLSPDDTVRVDVGSADHVNVVYEFPGGGSITLGSVP